MQWKRSSSQPQRTEDLVEVASRKGQQNERQQSATGMGQQPATKDFTIKINSVNTPNNLHVR
jgi:hypothetical protein